MKFKNIIITSFLTLSFLNNSSFASKLPDDVWNYVKTQLPNAQQRFDSVITLDNGLMYIPLYPPNTTNVPVIKSDYVYPTGKRLSEYPEVVLLNNGYSLLKVFKDDKGNYTLTQKDDLPIKVRLGLMPQDMLTPAGLKMPESLKLTLGDLLIPSLEETALAFRDDFTDKTKNPYNPTIKRNEFIPTVDFKNKKTFINSRNSKFLSVYDDTSQMPLYELKLASMPSKIITSDKTKVALVLYWSGKTLEIIDLSDERTIAQIEIDANATDVVLNQKANVAYVTSQNANKIYVIDLTAMQLKRVIKIDQKPSKITYCEIDDSISFIDEFQQKIFNITRSGDSYTVQPIGVVKNASKILADVANIYVITRTQNELYVFDKVQGKLIDTIDIDKKPTDAILYKNKLFILCSKEGYLDVYDTTEGTIVSREKLFDELKDEQTGFYSKMTLIPNQNNIIITGINSKSYLIYNLEEMKVVKKQDSYLDVANIVILDKIQGL